MPGMQRAPGTSSPESRPSLVAGSAPGSAPCWDERMSPPSHQSPGVQRVIRPSPPAPLFPAWSSQRDFWLPGWQLSGAQAASGLLGLLCSPCKAIPPLCVCPWRSVRLSWSCAGGGLRVVSMSALVLLMFLWIMLLWGCTSTRGEGARDSCGCG